MTPSRSSSVCGFCHSALARSCALVALAFLIVMYQLDFFGRLFQHVVAYTLDGGYRGWDREGVGGVDSPYTKLTFAGAGIITWPEQTWRSVFVSR